MLCKIDCSNKTDAQYYFLCLMTTISLQVEFGGGLELLFSNRKRHTLTLPSMVSLDNNTKVLPDALSGVETKPADIEYLLYHLRDHLLQERPELFMEDKTVYVKCPLHFQICSNRCVFRRPGILVLVNNTDWELEGEGEYVLQNNDEIVFISTLHGG